MRQIHFLFFIFRLSKYKNLRHFNEHVVRKKYKNPPPPLYMNGLFQKWGSVTDQSYHKRKKHKKCRARPQLGRTTRKSKVLSKSKHVNCSNFKLIKSFVSFWIAKNLIWRVKICFFQTLIEKLSTISLSLYKSNEIQKAHMPLNMGSYDPPIGDQQDKWTMYNGLQDILFNEK